MNMIGIGFQELLLIGVLLLIFVRPEELPAIFRKIGKLWAKVYYYYTLAKREFRNLEKEIGIEEEMKEIRSINARLNSEIANFDKDLTKKETKSTPDAKDEKAPEKEQEI